ncbi:MAG: GNAT family protein [Candidatus Woesearchaeota archaeon]
MVTIKAKSFLLRPIRLSDAQRYLECHHDVEAQKNFTSVPKTVAAARKEIKDNQSKKLVFAIEVDSNFAGFITLELNEHPRYKHSAIIGYGIHAGYRGRGLATGAVKKLTAYGFGELGLKRISGWCRTFNKASARVLQKAGYTHEGTIRKNKFVDGKYLDDMIWAKVKK